MLPVRLLVRAAAIITAGGVFTCCRTVTSGVVFADAAAAADGCVSGKEGCADPNWDLFDGLMSALKGGVADAEEAAAPGPHASAVSAVRDKMWIEAPVGTKVVLGQRPSRQDLSAELYAEVMEEIQDKSTKKDANMEKLFALSLCHTKPRSKGAWLHLASVELTSYCPFGFLRAKLIAELLDDDLEFLDEDENKDEDGNDAEERAENLEMATVRAQERADAFFSEGGGYKKLRAKLAVKFGGNPEAEDELAASDAMFKEVPPALIKWAASGSHAFPPIAFTNPDAAPLPPMWNSPTSKGAARPGKYMALFSTPIYVVNLMDHGAVTHEMNSAMAAGAIAAFEEFANRSKTGKRLSPDYLNNKFWMEQQYAPLTVSMPEVAEVIRHVYAASAQFLDEWGMAPEAMDWPTSQFLAKCSWFSIHSNGSIHTPHAHFDARLAIVYYPKVTDKDEGRLVFEDPRSRRYDKENSETCKGKSCRQMPNPHPPFVGNRYYHKPREGDLIIFPGWLYHQVDPVTSSDYRVSLSFNMDGYWTQSVP